MRQNSFNLPIVHYQANKEAQSNLEFWSSALENKPKIQKNTSPLNKL